jgi:hypothetical protein
MELGPGRPLYTRLAVPTLDLDVPYEAVAMLLEDVVKVIQRHARGPGGRADPHKHQPTAQEP